MEPPGPQHRVGLVDHQQGPGSAGELAQAVVVSRLGKDDSDVGERRLDQDAGDVAVGELALERAEVVDLDHPRGLGREATNTGHAPGHRVIQFIGTPESSDTSAR